MQRLRNEVRYTVAVSFALLVLAACSQPTAPEVDMTYFRGTVRGEPHGDPIMGASVAVDQYHSVTDYAGRFVVEIPADEQTSYRTVAIWKDSRYDFVVYGGFVFDTGGTAEYDFLLERSPLLPVVTNEYSVTLKNDSDEIITAGSDSFLGISFLSPNGQRSSFFSSISNGAPAQDLVDDGVVQIGGDLLMGVSSAVTGTYWYQPYGSMQTGDKTLELVVPGAINYTDVTVTGLETDAWVEGRLLVPGYDVPVTTGNAVEDGGGGATLPVFNVGSHSLTLATGVYVSNPGGSSGVHYYAESTGPIPGSADFTNVLDLVGPVSNVDLSSGFTWNRADRRISFGAVANADYYELEASSDQGQDVTIVSTSNELRLPQAFVRDVIDRGAGWNIQAEVWQRDPDWTLVDFTPAGRRAALDSTREYVFPAGGPGSFAEDVIP